MDNCPYPPRASPNARGFVPLTAKINTSVNVEFLDKMYVGDNYREATGGLRSLRELSRAGIGVRGITMGRRASAVKSRLRAKRRQVSKLAEIREALVADGFNSAGKQAIALGVSRPTAWALLNRDKRAGPSSVIIKRILSSPNLPAAARRKVEEYIEEKIAGVYGHTEGRRRWFRDQIFTI
jgi:hypothetical protein